MRNVCHIVFLGFLFLAEQPRETAADTATRTAALLFATAIAVAVVSACRFLSCPAATAAVVFAAAAATAATAVLVVVVVAATAAVIFSFETIAHDVFILRFFGRFKAFPSSPKTCFCPHFQYMTARL